MLIEMNWKLCPWKDILKKESIKLVDSRVREGISREETNQQGETEDASGNNYLFYSLEWGSTSWID